MKKIILFSQKLVEKNGHKVGFLNTFVSPCGYGSRPLHGEENGSS